MIESGTSVRVGDKAGIEGRVDEERPWFSPEQDLDSEMAGEHFYCSGSPAEEIVGLARTIPVDHIVIGAHGQPAHHRIEIGRTAMQVVRASPCSVTVVSEDEVPQLDD